MSFVLPDWPPEAHAGAEHFNARRYFESHEDWEEVWHRSRGHVASFYQGLIQLAAAMVKVKAGNHNGATRLLASGLEKLEPLVPAGAPLRLSTLVQDARSVAGLLASLGPGGMDRFPESAWLSLSFWGVGSTPGLSVTGFDDRAAEGVRLFDAGQWWEAHEHFEDVMAEAPGDEPLFYKALIHAGSALLKFDAGQVRPARHLAKSALNILEWMGPFQVPESAHLRLDGLVATLEWLLKEERIPAPLPRPRLGRG